MGVAVRTYFTQPAARRRLARVLAGAVGRTTPGRTILLPGYGWIFGVGDGTSNVGLGILNTSTAFGKVDYKDLLQRWVATMPDGVGLHARDHEVGPIRGAALPMGFNRTAALHPRPAAGRRRRRHGQPVQRRGHRLRHGVRPARRRGRRPGAGPADATPARARAAGVPAGDEGRSWAATTRSAGSSCRLIGHPQVMRLATRYGLPRPTLMRFILKLLANLDRAARRRRDGPRHQRADQDSHRRHDPGHAPRTSPSGGTGRTDAQHPRTIGYRKGAVSR